MDKEIDLKPINEELDKFEIDENDVNENDKVEIYEVYRKGDLILYEFEDEDIGPIVPIEIINELFPEFKTDLNKYYLIEKNGEFYY